MEALIHHGRNQNGCRSAVIFDLDGTLTLPFLDFDLIRKEIGIPSGPILEALEGMASSEKSRAEAILLRHERVAAEHAMLRPGVHLVFEHLRTAGRSIGILTRNARTTTSQILTRFGLTVDAVRTREDGAIKPAPDGVLSLCQEMGADARQSWVIGDYLFDILAGKGAGSRTILLVDSAETPAYAHEADFVIREMSEVITICGISSVPATEQSAH